MTPIVFLDIDDTLFDFKRSEAEALSKMLRSFAIAPTTERITVYSKINASCWKQLEAGILTREEVLQRRFTLFFQAEGIDCPSSEAKARYEENLSRTVFYLPGAVDLLETLSSRYPLYALSNGTAKVQRGRIGASGIDRYFERIFISEQIGFNKPDRRFFERCFAEIPPFDKRKSILIGDSLTSDIKGAENAGIPSLWYNPHHEEPTEGAMPTIITDSLTGIPAILASFFAE